MNMILQIFLIITLLLVASCSIDNKPKEKIPLTETQKKDLEVATFAGGCFWCVEADFEKVPGVKQAISGYIGGSVENPEYKEVSSGETGHREAVEVYFDPSNVTYNELLDVFFKHHDPTDEGGSFYDRGHQYTSAIYYHSEEQKTLAETKLKSINESGIYTEPIVTSIEPATKFYVAEEYHQDYYKKNPVRYGYYRRGSGRDSYIEEIWGEK